MGQDEAGTPKHGGETPQRPDVEASVFFDYSTTIFCLKVNRYG